MTPYSMRRLLDHDYRVMARRYCLLSSRSTNDIAKFPIEKARMRSIFPILIMSAIATAGYGRTLQTKAHISAPLDVQFTIGSILVAIFLVCGSLLTGLNPGRSATIQGSYNLVRCAFGAAEIAALKAAIDRLGVGWCFTIQAVMGTFSLPLLLVLKCRGEQWPKKGARNGQDNADTKPNRRSNPPSPSIRPNDHVN